MCAYPQPGHLVHLIGELGFKCHLALREGIEPPTLGLEILCSILLSYRSILSSFITYSGYCLAWIIAHGQPPGTRIQNIQIKGLLRYQLRQRLILDSFITCLGYRLQGRVPKVPHLILTTCSLQQLGLWSV